MSQSTSHTGHASSSSISHINNNNNNGNSEITHVRHRHDRLSLGMSADLGIGTSQIAGYGRGYEEGMATNENGQVRRRVKGRKRKDKQGKGGVRKKKSKIFPWAFKRGWVQEGFRQFGEHCARNQIRTLLIDCLVMTNLFYPSLALYLQKRFPPIPIQNGKTAPVKEHPLSLLNMPILDTFFPYPPPLLPRIEWGGWWGRDTGQTSAISGSTTWVSVPAPTECEGGEEVVEWVRVAWADVGDVLDRDSDNSAVKWSNRDKALYKSIRTLVEHWSIEEKGTGAECVRTMVSDDEASVSNDGPCYIFSPDITSSSIAIDSSRISHEPQPMALISSSNIDDLDENRLLDYEGDDLIYHTLAIPFRLGSTLASSRANFLSRWNDRLAEIAQGVDGEVFTEAKDRSGGVSTVGTFHVTLSKKDPSNPTPRTSSTYVSSSPPRLVLVLYAVLLLTLLAQLANATKVHSRFGLAFTGVVQLCCSSVMSFSVLALLGWNGWGWSLRENVLPTYLLPFVIVVVGAENMSTLTKAVFSVPFTYSVPVRIGIGLSKVGSTIALTSLTDLLLLGIGWFCVNLPPVREFCIFAAVVIITDWFMLHTFFLTVLSIDAQRLELADVLAANDGMSTSEGRKIEQEEANSKQNRFNWRNVLRARTAKSASLILLLVCVALMYNYNENNRPSAKSPAHLYGYVPSPASGRASASSLPTATLSSTYFAFLSPAEQFWHVLNPHGWPSLHVTVPPASIIILPRPGHSMLPADIRKLSLPATRLLLPRLKPIFVFAKVVIFPQAVSAFALYILLLYLLKDADLLDAQRNRVGRGEVNHTSSKDESDPSTSKSASVLALKSKFGLKSRSSLDSGSPSLGLSVANGISVHMLPCTHESDVDVVATSEDGMMMISIGIDNSIVLWRFDNISTTSSSNSFSSQRIAGTREILVSPHLALSDPIVTAALKIQYDNSPANGKKNALVAVASASGVIQLWTVPDHGRVNVLSPIRIRMPMERNLLVSRIVLDSSEKTVANVNDDPFTAGPATSPACPIGTGTSVVAALSNGAVISIDITDAESSVPIIPASKGKSIFVELLPGTNQGLMIFSANIEDGLRLWHRLPASAVELDFNGVASSSTKMTSTFEWKFIQLASALEVSDQVTAVSTKRVVWFDATVELIIIGRKSGNVELFSVTSGNLIALLGDNGSNIIGDNLPNSSMNDPRLDGYTTYPFPSFPSSLSNSITPPDGAKRGPIRRVAISCPPLIRCTSCDYLWTDGFFILFSTAENVHVSRIVPKGSLICRCPAQSSSHPSRMTDSGGNGGVGTNYDEMGFPFVLPPKGSPARAGFNSGSISGTIGGLGFFSGNSAPTQVNGVAGNTGPSPYRTRPSPGGSPKRSSGLLPLVTNEDFPISSHGGRRASNITTGAGGAGGLESGINPNPSSGFVGGSVPMSFPVESTYPNQNYNQYTHLSSPPDRQGSGPITATATSTKNARMSSSKSPSASTTGLASASSAMSLPTPGSSSSTSNSASLAHTPGDAQEHLSAEAEVVLLGSIPTSTWALPVRRSPNSNNNTNLHGSSTHWRGENEIIMGLRRDGNGIDDAQWLVWTLDLSRPWNGSNLIVDTSNLSQLERRTRLSSSSGKSSSLPSSRRPSIALSMGLGRSPSSRRGSSVVSSINNFLSPNTVKTQGCSSGQTNLGLPHLQTIPGGSAIDDDFTDDAFGGEENIGVGGGGVGSAGVSLRSARAERILSLDGRASFSTGESSGIGSRNHGSSSAVPTHAAIGYVRVHPFEVGGTSGEMLGAPIISVGGGTFGAVLAGFGNRVGILVPPLLRPKSGSSQHGGGTGGFHPSTVASASTSGSSRILRTRRSTSQSFHLASTSIGPTQQTHTQTQNQGQGIQLEGSSNVGEILSNMSSSTSNMTMNVSTPISRRMSACNDSSGVSMSGGGGAHCNPSSPHMGTGVVGLGMGMGQVGTTMSGPPPQSQAQKRPINSLTGAL